MLCACNAHAPVFVFLLLGIAIFLHGCGESQAPKPPADPIHVRANLMSAVDILAESVPGESGSLKKNKNDIIDFLMNYSDPKPHSHLLAVQFSKDIGTDGGLSEPGLQSPRLNDTCKNHLVTVMADAVSVIAGLLSFNIPASMLSYDSWVKANPQAANGILVNTEAFQKAVTPKDKAVAFFALIKKVFTSQGFSQLWNAMRNSLTTWWQWVKLCVTMVAQLALWFASDSAAFMAQLTFALLSETQLVIDSDMCVKACRVTSTKLVTV